ncbi:hypothetical protein DRN67_02780 [Candidatus Micrarchaeota archaeon]|nr:MAG: hypothetical protein DRN67_02780 [Candidatus Micrarchaeota archaeon]
MKNRGQAAIEYLSTYGWAVLVIALVLAALIWLGVFDASQNVPDRCSFQGSIECTSPLLRLDTMNNEVDMESVLITNRMSETMYVCAVLCTNDVDLALDNIGGSIPMPTECATPPQDANQPVLQPGEQADIAPPSAYGVATLVDFDSCYEYFAGQQNTYTTYSQGDRFVGSLILFYSLAADANSNGNARMMIGDVVTTIQ